MFAAYSLTRSGNASPPKVAALYQAKVTADCKSDRTGRLREPAAEFLMAQMVLQVRWGGGGMAGRRGDRRGRGQGGRGKTPLA
jgi:hypothetical protein